MTLKPLIAGALTISLMADPGLVYAVMTPADPQASMRSDTVMCSSSALEFPLFFSGRPFLGSRHLLRQVFGATAALAVVLILPPGNSPVRGETMAAQMQEMTAKALAEELKKGSTPEEKIAVIKRLADKVTRLAPMTNERYAALAALIEIGLEDPSAQVRREASDVLTAAARQRNAGEGQDEASSEVIRGMNSAFGSLSVEMPKYEIIRIFFQVFPLRAYVMLTDLYERSYPEEVQFFKQAGQFANSIRYAQLTTESRTAMTEDLMSYARSYLKTDSKGTPRREASHQLFLETVEQLAKTISETGPGAYAASKAGNPQRIRALADQLNSIILFLVPNQPAPKAGLLPVFPAARRTAFIAA